MYTIQPKRNNLTVVRKRPDCRKACSASPNGMSHATKKALSCCKRYHSTRRKRLFRKTEDKAPRAVGSLTAYQSADYGKTAKNVIFRENSVRGVRVSEYGSFRDNVLTFSIYNMLIYIYPKLFRHIMSAILSHTVTRSSDQATRRCVTVSVTRYHDNDAEESLAACVR